MGILSIHKEKGWVTWIPATLVIGMMFGAGSFKAFQVTELSPMAVTSEKIPKPSVENSISDVNLITPQSLNVSDITLTKKGFLVIISQSENVDDVIAVSDLLSQGKTLNLRLDLIEAVRSEETLYSKLYLDDGNGVFDVAKDILARDDEGNSVKVRVSI